MPNVVVGRKSAPQLPNPVQLKIGLLLPRSVPWFRPAIFSHSDGSMSDTIFADYFLALRKYISMYLIAADKTARLGNRESMYSRRE
jgi:hypothetical protein